MKSLLFLSIATVAHAATPVSDIKVPPGFKVELLREAGEREGSWISMALDAEGRIYISPQGSIPESGMAKDSKWGGLWRSTVVEGKVTAWERVPVPVGDSMGMLWAFDSLYVSGNGPEGRGIYRCKDTDGDGLPDTAVMWKKVPGGSGEHGAHALVLSPDKKNITIVHGNATGLIDGIAPDSPYRNWGEDDLLPKLKDPTATFFDSIKAPYGYVVRTDEEGKKWQLIAGGFRNPYDIAFNADGELFTYDSDMERDRGLPWYRPTRVLHIVPGGEYGFREGSAKMPAYYPDTLPAVVDVGLGCPTGVKFGTLSNFGEKYRRAFFACDWTYGRILAVHMKEKGASYTATNPLASYTFPKDAESSADVEPFVVGKGMPVTDVEFLKDGSMVFTTGGRGTSAGLYRVSYEKSQHSQQGQQKRGLPLVTEEATQQAAKQLAAIRRMEAIADEKKPISPPISEHGRAIGLTRGGPTFAERMEALKPEPPVGARGTVSGSPSVAPVELDETLARELNKPPVVENGAAIGLNDLRFKRPPLNSIFSIRFCGENSPTLKGDVERVSREIMEENLQKVLAQARVAITSTVSGTAEAFEPKPITGDDGKQWVGIIPSLGQVMVDNGADLSPERKEQLKRQIRETAYPEFSNFAKVWARPSVPNTAAAIARMKWAMRNLDKKSPEYMRSELLISAMSIAVVGEAQHQEQLLDALTHVPLAILDDYWKFWKLRILQLTFARHGRPSDEWQKLGLEKLLASYPAQGPRAADLNRELCQLLVWLSQPELGDMNLADGINLPKDIPQPLKDTVQPFNLAPKSTAEGTQKQKDTAVLQRDSSKPAPNPGAVIHPERKGQAFHAELGQQVIEKTLALLESGTGVPPVGQTGVSPVSASGGTPNGPTAGTAVLPSQEEQITYALNLRWAHGWTPAQRERYFRWFHEKAARFPGGNSMQGFIRKIHAEAVSRVPDSEKVALAKWLVPLTGPAPELISPRAAINAWTLAGLEKELDALNGYKPDVARGKAFFAEAQCSRCHLFKDTGGNVGPDLTAVAQRFQRHDILEAITDPNKVVSDQYALTTLTVIKFGGGEEQVTGLLQEETSGTIRILTDPLTGTSREFYHNVVKKKEKAPVSLMPPGLLNIMTAEEVADLLAFLSGGK